YNIVSVLLLSAQYTFTAIMIIWALSAIALNSTGGLHRVIRFWGNGILRIMGKKLHLRGIEHIEKGKNYLLLTNHASLYDIPALMSFYPRVSWLGRSYLLKVPVFGTFLKKTDYIPIDPGNIDETRKVLAQLLQKSENLTVAIFPEGTRTLDGNLQRFRKGFLYLLKSADIDILPVTLNGLYSLKPKNRFHIDLKTKIGAVIHQPVKKTDLADKSDGEILDKMKEIIQSGYYCREN
ncbi:MAG: 1-acyl-sn-glycerol-3-phosphate acyltransferase, partial [bacterium]|nr:1-acyl-sn-glycerol-3-phosphate acyltransferase [bacterium]